MGRDKKKLYDGDVLIYDGEVLNDKPYGTGIAYYPNGNRYMEGIFGIKGFLKGKIYYENGQVRFSGNYCLNRGYGPNFPVSGDYYSESGELIFSGEFKLHIGGVGWRTVEEPKGYRTETPGAPKLPAVTFDEAKSDSD